MSTKTDYYLATGTIRVKETTLISSDALLRMIDAVHASDAYKVLAEFDYSDELINVDTPEQYEAVLTHDFLQTKEFLRNITQDLNVYLWLFSEFDVHNLKVLFKLRYFEHDLSEHLSHLGVVDTERLKKAVLEDGEQINETEIQDIINETRALFDGRKDVSAELLDVYLDRAWYSLVVRTSKKLGSAVLADIARKRIDLANVKLMSRAKMLGKSFDFVENRLIHGGAIDVELYAERFEAEDATVFYNEVSKNFISPAVEDMFADAVESEKLADLEKSFELYEVKLARLAKNQPFGIEVLFGYVMAKFLANRNIRRVMSGKLNNVAPTEIREHITELV